MAVGHGVLGEPHLQRASEPARGVLDQMREAIVGDRFLPMTQDLPDGRLPGGARMTHDEFCPSARATAFLQLDRPPGNC